MAETIVDDRLWENFHRAVNMTSRELRDWLAVQGAGEETETEPDRAGSELGHHVADILGKRRADLTPDDVAVMRRVVDKVADLRGEGEEWEPTAGDDRWRRRLMNVGHDPLKP
ncbi:DUF3140 domain-containing protein [Nocardioides sp.]|jgi:hypothetical protein|uniref:DUF3140 domain-containing protein n=1 Tax=Nocardioides sp. TaxID=35761 RepID=UPI002CA7F275|nr:DUF3140 domain-containing protein [Nocardioides sp.]HVX54007.1 DUF3140 domain-containing protein [Nocardioides sp.]